MEPRAVLVHRSTEFTGLLHDHGTRGKAAFFLKTRGDDLARVERAHALQERAMAAVRKAIPRRWRRATVERGDLDRFLFEPGDILIAVGQDGLVANVAKYLDGQPVVGIDPDPGANPGVLVAHRPEDAGDLLAAVASGTAAVQSRCMVRAATDDGVALLALNELFVGHRTHQSARYEIDMGDGPVFQSSSGLIVATGTGCTGWAASVHRGHNSALSLPAPQRRQLVFFVREAWPGPGCDVRVTEGLLGPQQALRITCRMPEGGVVFGDGIEADSVPLRWGQTLEITTASRRLRLVAPRVEPRAGLVRPRRSA